MILPQLLSSDPKLSKAVFMSTNIAEAVVCPCGCFSSASGVHLRFMFGDFNNVSPGGFSLEGAPEQLCEAALRRDDHGGG